MGGEEKERLIFSFENPDNVQQWQHIDDTVMGGISGSQMKYSGNRTALFTGNVSLENFGGFASVRSRTGDYDLSMYTGITLRVKGDGKRYKLNLKTDAAFDSTLYQTQFDTEKDNWKNVYLPFSDFVPTFRGRVLTNVPIVDTHSIKSFGFLIADKQEGRFQLEIEWIKAYRK